MFLACDKAESRAQRIVLDVIAMLPVALGREILRIGGVRRDFPSRLSEIRVRGRGRSSLVLSGENIPLFTRLTSGDMSNLYDRILSGSLYAHEREVKNGFVSLGGGIRVGISAHLSENDGFPREISSLVFRLPSSPSESAEKLFDAWKREREGGMLIYSLPGAGKTSALRAMAALVSARTMKRVAVIDERREFIPDDYKELSVDILSGYTKPFGLEIALRTLSPELIIIDEIGSSDETEALLKVGRGGVPVIATAHAASFDEVIRKSSIKKLISEGYFNLFAGLASENGKFTCEIKTGDE